MSEVQRRVVDRCASTNDLARSMGEAGAAHGSWVSARVQESGRGRMGRQWQSVEGNLFLSLIARIEDKSRWTWVPIATAVGVARWLEREFPQLDARIKWPNDLWIMSVESPASAPIGAKLGGVLCEAVGTRGDSFIIVGLGMNCRAAPEGLDQQTVSLSAALGRAIVADEVREAVAAAVMGAIDELVASGSAQLMRDFEHKAAFARDAGIEWSAPGADPALAQQGKVVGLGPLGELIVRLDDGSEKKIYAEDVRVRSSQRKASYGSPA